MLDNFEKPGAEFKDADKDTNDRFVERNGEMAYRMTCDLHEGYVRQGLKRKSHSKSVILVRILKTKTWKIVEYL